MRPGRDVPTLVPGLDGGIDHSSPVLLEPVLEDDPPVRGWDRVCFLERHRRAWMNGVILREKGDGPGGRVSLLDHRRS